MGKEKANIRKENLRISALNQMSIEENRNKIRNSWTKDMREKQRQRMFNGGIVYTHKFIKKISKGEIKLRNIIKELYSTAEPQYPILNYVVDIALVYHKIAIEYDGYYHFNSEENKEYHKNRQEKIEKEGWKFYRITMFDKFPSIEKIKEDIERLLSE